jgi:hypothetical protein
MGAALIPFGRIWFEIPTIIISACQNPNKYEIPTSYNPSGYEISTNQNPDRYLFPKKKSQD